ncbi:diacylglycerol/lipid kinase family protein [Neorhodopirellula pilleata]|uniref:Diacylglycerol kinase n=1 Tax=Neorhodopirellula pilleata TaxID=2714738 RepID=A0A5C6ATN6_9BACT|nr:diacylglycerol kinase family protein [Neorhodopirellula pilleata]TWU03090.1 Diacylglycerol kinase [Neorhodopirellula pilleata]
MIARQVARVAVFTSPRAGSGARREQIPRLLELLNRDKISIELIHQPQQLRDWIDQTTVLGGESPGEASSVIVAAGGDGTVTLAASLIHATRENSAADQANLPLLVPLPLGTENLLARYFGHQADAEQVRETILRGPIDLIDLGLVQRPNQRCHPMLTMVSCGFDADVVRRLHLRRRGHIRRLSYLGPILRSIGRYRFPELVVQSIDNDHVEREIRCGWAMVFNLPRYGGGLTIEPDALGNDGFFDVITFAGRGIASGLKYVAGIRSGRHLSDGGVQRFRSRDIRITSEQRVHYQIDGDYIGRLPIEISIRPHAIALLLPAVLK